MNKKEFKKKCKKEKTRGYKLTTVGTIISCMGLIIVLITLLLDNNEFFEYPMQIVWYIIGAIISFIAMVLEIVGEYEISKQFKEYIKENNLFK